MSRLLPAPASDDPYLAAPGAEATAEFQQACVEFFGDVVHALGVPRSVGQIYGLLYASPQPLSFTDIAQKLDISRGSTSQGLQALRELGAVIPVAEGTKDQRREGKDQRLETRDQRLETRDQGLETRDQVPKTRERRPEARDQRLAGGRRELFQPEFSLRKLVSGVLREKVDPIVSDGGRRMTALRALADAAPTDAGKRFSRARVKQLESWRRQLGLLLPLLKTILGPVRE